MKHSLEKGISDADIVEILRNFFVLPKRINKTAYIAIASAGLYYHGEEARNSNEFWLPLYSEWVDTCNGLGVDPEEFDEMVIDFESGVALKNLINGCSQSDALNKVGNGQNLLTKLSDEAKRLIFMKKSLFDTDIDYSGLTNEQIQAFFNPSSPSFNQNATIIYHTIPTDDKNILVSDELARQANQNRNILRQVNDGRIQYKLDYPVFFRPFKFKADFVYRCYFIHVQNTKHGKILPTGANTPDLPFLHKLQIMTDPEDLLGLKTGTLTSIRNSMGDRFVENMFMRNFFECSIPNLIDYPEALLNVMNNVLHNISPNKSTNPLLNDPSFYSELMAAIKLSEQVIRENQSRISEMASVRRKILKLSSSIVAIDREIGKYPDLVGAFGRLKEMTENIIKTKDVNDEDIIKYLESSWSNKPLEPVPDADSYLFFERREFQAMKSEMELIYSKSESEFQEFFSALMIKMMDDANSPIRYFGKILRDEGQTKILFGDKIGEKMIEIYKILRNPGHGDHLKLYQDACTKNYFDKTEEYAVVLGQKVNLMPEATFADTNLFRQLLNTQTIQRQNREHTPGTRPSILQDAANTERQDRQNDAHQDTQAQNFRMPVRVEQRRAEATEGEEMMPE